MATEKRLIDAKKYFEALRDDLELSGKYFRIAVDHLNEMPTVDAVEVVRCKDCKYGEPLVETWDNKVWCGYRKCFCKERQWQQNLIVIIVESKVRAGMVKTNNRKSVIHTGMLLALGQTSEKGKTMTDSEKISLVRAMIEDFWACSNVTEDSTVCLLNSITVVINFDGKEEENAEN